MFYNASIMAIYTLVGDLNQQWWLMLVYGIDLALTLAFCTADASISFLGSEFSTIKLHKHQSQLTIMFALCCCSLRPVLVITLLVITVPLHQRWEKHSLCSQVYLRGLMIFTSFPPRWAVLWPTSAHTFGKVCILFGSCDHNRLSIENGSSYWERFQLLRTFL